MHHTGKKESKKEKEKKRSRKICFKGIRARTLRNSPSAESRKFGFMAHSRGTAETCHILIFDY